MIQLVKHVVKRALPAGHWERFRARWWRYLRPLTVDYCPVMLPWFTSARSGSPAARLHRLATSFHWENRWSPVTALALGVATVRWPFRFAYESTRAVLEYGSDVAGKYGVSRSRQAAQILRHGLRDNIPALYYYRFRLFDPANAGGAAAFLHPEEMSVLHPTLALGHPADDPLRDKELFFAHGLDHGLPVVPAVAIFGNGALKQWYASPSEVLPEADLVLKPVDNGGGNGFQLWTFDAGSKTWRRGGDALDASQFLEHCARCSALHRHVLQRRLRNHPELSGLSGKGLSTLRIVTYRRVDGTAGTIVECLRMPTGQSVIDNFDAGGITAPITSSSGTLGAAVAKDPRPGPFSRHPDSNAPIEGNVVPHYAAARALALRAHACFPWVPFVGWDVVVTPDGPVLLEANPDFGVEHSQISMGRPLGETVYPEVYFEYLAAVRGPRGDAPSAAQPKRSGQSRALAPNP